MANKTKTSFDFKQINQTKIRFHILVWLMFFALPFYIISTEENQNYGLLFLAGINILVFYFNFSLLVPKYLVKKKWSSYFSFLLLVLVLYIVLFSFLMHLRPPMPPKELSHLPPPNFNKKMSFIRRYDLFPTSFSFILMISASSFLKLYEIWDENFKRQKEIESENRTMELNFLKSQLNPHFFFNSLNTIYSLSISKSEKTSEAILNLSELMRYMLSYKKNDTINSKVKLIDELNYISNYIELQKLRITPNNNIDFEVIGETYNVEIYPLLFISFIENAFKFGVHPIVESKIKILFKIQGDDLYFEVINDCHFQKNSYDSFGLGNENSIKRLSLYYPNNQLQIEKNKKYKVSLLINLNEN